MIRLICEIALLCVCIFLLIRLLGLRHALNKLPARLRECMQADTNALITTTCADASLRAFASELNRQLRALRAEQLRLQNGNHELQAAITNISHDLRTPLTAIHGYLELLDGTQLPPRAREYCDVIAERTQTLCELTGELFKYSVVSATADALHPEPVDIKAVLEESIAGFYQLLSERQITPRLWLPEGAVVRSLDKKALRRIFDNLIGNAVKYSRGDLTVRLTQDGSVSFLNAADGLDSVSVGKLFDRFYTVESARDSTGIGLSIAKLLTEKMGGSIHAALQNGTLELRLRFPLNP